MPVAVEGQRHSAALDDLLEHQHVALRVLLLPEQGEGNHSRGVVHGADQGQAWPPTLQPVVTAPIDLQQHPLLGVACPAQVAPARAPAPGTADPTRQQDSPDGGAREVDALPPGQHLGQMRVVETGVAALSQGQHPLLNLCSRGGRRSPASVSVCYGGSSLLSIRRQ